MKSPERIIREVANNDYGFDSRYELVRRQRDRRVRLNLVVGLVSLFALLSAGWVVLS